MDILDRLLGHDQWTTGELLRRARELTDAQLDQEFDIGHRTLRATFAHIIGNIEIWTDLMNQKQPDLATPRDDSLDGLTTRFGVAYYHFKEFARYIREIRRYNAMWTDTLDDPPTQKSYGGAIIHLVTHSMHHRSELLHIMARLGLTDLPEGDVLSWEMHHKQ